jgi:hypothetical protein
MGSKATRVVTWGKGREVKGDQAAIFIRKGSRVSATSREVLGLQFNGEGINIEWVGRWLSRTLGLKLHQKNIK